MAHISRLGFMKNKIETKYTCSHKRDQYDIISLFFKEQEFIIFLPEYKKFVNR